MGDNGKADTSVEDLQQQQMLRIIARGFYKELINYGVKKKDIVTVSTQLLDCLLKEQVTARLNSQSYSSHFAVQDIYDEWQANKALRMQEVSISPLQPESYPRISAWLANPAVRFSFVPPFPDTEDGLKRHFENPSRQFFSILHAGEAVGIIGADNIDNDARKLEMKKLVGESDMQGKGIGKQATFLFLYYVFSIMGFDKVYIHSGNTNIRNINLNTKFGFELEGIFLDEVVVRNKRHDIVRMGLLKSRWIEMFCTLSCGPGTEPVL